jgi:hypothetical protein
VTAADVTNLGNLSGTNTGDQDLSSYATKTGAETLTNKTITKRVSALTDTTTIAVNSEGFDIGTVTLAGNRTLGADSGTAVDGQTMTLRVTQDGTGARTLAFASTAGGYAFSDDLASPTLSTAANAIDYLRFIYHSGDDRWHLLAINRGF